MSDYEPNVGKTFWEAYQDDLQPVTCQQCMKEKEDIYYLDDEIWCRDCLESEVVERHPSLTAAERNSGIF